MLGKQGGTTMDQIKVSIITTTYNDSKNLKNTIDQVLKQDYKNIEYIIVDGLSTDDTLSVIKEAEELFKGRMKWISEKDDGIYDAINKGIKMATGDIIGCCFDTFSDNHVISDMVVAIENERTDGVHGDLLYVEGDKVVRTWRQRSGSIRYGWMPGHPTLYLKKVVYDTYGLYKTDYTCSADYEFIVRILKDEKVKLSYIPRVLIKMSYGGTSTNGLKAYLVSLKEGHRALKENGIRFAWITDFFRIFRVLLQFVIK